MARFKDDEDYDNFAYYIRHIARHFLDGPRYSFIDAVVQTSKDRTIVIPKGQVLWRAALGYVAEEGVLPHDMFFLYSIEPHPLQRMKPLKSRAQEGRINPKGIPCLYTATDAETAMMETRPWADSVLTVSELVLLKEITAVDCSMPVAFELHNEPTREQLENNNWHVINNAFSEPVTRNDDVADYAPTQFLAEAFRNEGYDGIVYASKLGKGKNVALFDIDVAEVASRRLCHVTNISIRFREVGKTLYVGKYKEQFGVVDELEPDAAQPTDDDVPF